MTILLPLINCFFPAIVIQYKCWDSIAASGMDCPLYRTSVNVFSWLFLLAFLHHHQVTKGTGFDVFNQAPSKEKYYPDYRLYHNLSRLNECIHDLVARFPDVLDTQMRFRSRWGLSQYVLHFTNHSTNTKVSDKNRPQKTKILMVSGGHASEFLPVESMMYLLKNLTGGLDNPGDYSAYNFSRFVLDKIDLYLIAMLNPDGRMILERTLNYCWKETASKADLNNHGSSATPLYASQVLVEPECRVLSEFTSTMKFDAVVFMHSGRNEIIVPVYDNSELSTKSHYPDSKEIDSMAMLLSDLSPFPLSQTKLKSSHHRYGESLLSYIAFTKQVPFTFLVSLWRHRKVYKRGSNCFAMHNPSSQQLKETLQSIHPMYVALFQNMVHWKEGSFKTVMERTRLERRSSQGLSSYNRIFLFLLILTVIVFVTRFKLPLGWKMLFRRQRRIVSLRSLSSAFSFFLI